MICKSCGNEVKNGAKFCNICGAAVKISGGTINLSKENNNMPDASFNNTEELGMPELNINDINMNKQEKQNLYDNDVIEEDLTLPKFGAYNIPVYNQGFGSPRFVGFVDAMKLFIGNYFNFSGRSTRSEFLMPQIVSFIYILIASMVMNIITNATNENDEFGISGIVSLIFFTGIVFLLIPTISSVVRRLHDISKSGKLGLIVIFPVIGAIVLIVFLCKPSVDDANPWGPAPDPKVKPDLF